jgi:hypothetical protein
MGPLRIRRNGVLDDIDVHFEAMGLLAGRGHDAPSTPRGEGLYPAELGAALDALMLRDRMPPVAPADRRPVGCRFDGFPATPERPIRTRM